MINSQQPSSYWSRYIALPQDHGSWIFLLSPLLIGLFAGGTWSLASLLLILAVISAFLLRQPITIAIKAYSGRRPLSELPAARFWIVIYSLIALPSLVGLIVLGYYYLLYLAFPGLPVFAWHLLLVSRRAERRQVGVEIVATGVLALSALAAYWIGQQGAFTSGWWLFVLTWFQSSASIVYAYLRLDQRSLKVRPDIRTCLYMARRALLYTTFNLLAVITFSTLGWLPTWLPLAYALQWGETVWGTINPAIGAKPTAIGFRQLAVSSLFTVIFILTWNI